MDVEDAFLDVQLAMSAFGGLLVPTEFLVQREAEMAERIGDQVKEKAGIDALEVEPDKRKRDMEKERVTQDVMKTKIEACMDAIREATADDAEK
jgi:hypothetical protein